MMKVLTSYYLDSSSQLKNRVEKHKVTIVLKRVSEYLRSFPRFRKMALSSVTDQAERTFAKAFLNTISTQPVTYPDDYQQPSEHSLKRVPVLQVGYLFRLHLSWIRTQRATLI